MFRKLKYTFIGRPLKSLTDGEGGLLGKMQALAMLSSDALSSIAYGPEQVIQKEDVLDVLFFNLYHSSFEKVNCSSKA